MTPRILIAEQQFSPQAAAVLRSMGEVTVEERAEISLGDIIAPYHILIVRLTHRVSREVIARAPHLRIIGTLTTGLDHIDLAAAAERGIAVVSLKGETAFLKEVRAVVEHTFALLLTLIRRMPQAARAGASGKWTQQPFCGSELYQKTIGIIGFGRIGSAVSRIAQSFGMRVLVHDPYVVEATIRAENALPMTLADLLRQADIVSVHVPLSNETKQLIDRQAFENMKPGSLLINTARGDIIDEEALLSALKSGTLAGACVDVLSREKEPLALPTDPLVGYAKDHDNLIITPHIAGTTRESLEKTQVFIANKVVLAARSLFHLR